MFQRILLVCVGNICRSPIAAVLLRHYLPDATVTSAGLNAMVGRPMAADARAVLAAHGFHPGSHVARQLEDNLLQAADLILVMEQVQIEMITRQVPQALGRTFLLGRWQRELEIDDPYGQPHVAFERTFRLIETAVTSWLPWLQPADSRNRAARAVRARG